MLVMAAKNRSWLVAAIPNTKYIVKNYPACNVYNDIRHNRQQKADLDAAGSSGGGENDKTNLKTNPVKARLRGAS